MPYVFVDLAVMPFCPSFCSLGQFAFFFFFFFADMHTSYSNQNLRVRSDQGEFISANENGTVSVWDLAKEGKRALKQTLVVCPNRINHRVKKMIEIKERPLSVCISDDASMLLVGTTTGNVVLFDPRYVLLSYFVAPLGGGIYRTKDYSTDPDKYPQASPLFAKYFDCFSTLHCRPPVSHAKYLHIQTPLALTVQTQK